MLLLDLGNNRLRPLCLEIKRKQKQKQRKKCKEKEKTLPFGNINKYCKAKLGDDA